MQMAAPVSITEAIVKAAQAGEKTMFIRDRALPGFALRVTPGGAKSFVVEGRAKGRFLRYTIGSTSKFTVAEARAAARKTLVGMADGKDPQTIKRAKREQSATLGAMLESYIGAKNIRPSTAAHYRSQMRRCLGDWLEKPIASITPQMVLLRYEALCKRSVAEANGVMRVLRAVSRRAVKLLPPRQDGAPMMRDVPTSSLQGEWRTLERKKTLLQPAEIPAWWAAVEQTQSADSRRALQALLLTGLRISEVLALRWEDFGADDRALKICQSKTTAFKKFIGPALTAMLKDWRGAAEPGWRILPVDDLRAALKQTVKAGAKRVTPHDLRRTYLTFGERAGAPFVVLKMLVNHSLKNDITGGYIVPSDDDLRHWAAEIESKILAAAGRAP